MLCSAVKFTRSFIVIERDAHDFKTLIVIAVVDGHHVAYFLPAWGAPCRPEIDKDHFAAHGSKIDLRAIDGLEFQIERFVVLAAGKSQQTKRKKGDTKENTIHG
jgi:hypothetical protein